MNFYVLQQYLVNKTPAETEFSYIGDENQRGAPHCPACGDCVGSLTRVPPHAVELEVWHRQFGDFAFGVSDALLVSERVKAVCEEHGVVGLLGCDPVEVVRVKKHKRFNGDPPSYFHVTVMRGPAAVDQQQSGYQWVKPPTCPHCRLGSAKRWDRLVLEPNTWSGEDIFIPRGLSATYVVAQRFKDICEQYRVSNAFFIPADEYEHDFYPWENIERARELAAMELSEELVEKIKPNGERWRYYFKRNELVIIHPDGRLEINRPLEGVDFWNRQ